MTNSFYRWIESHATDNPAALRLKYSRSKDSDIDYADAILQIECRQKFGKKLADTLAAYPRFHFPSVLSGEQATSDMLAAYHSSLMSEGLEAADLTAGLGIDVFHISSRASSVTAVEMDAARAEALRANAAGLHIDNLEVVCADCHDFIDDCIRDGRHFGAIFIDPARRSDSGGRLFALADCRPDVTAMTAKLSQICSLLVIKASPMLDISHTVAALSPTPVAAIALGTATECKELVILVVFDNKQAQTLIEAVTIHGQGADTFTFTSQQEKECAAPEAMPPLLPGDYIYEAYPSLMKTGAHKLVASRFGLKGFHPNTRLYASHEAVDGFPGTRYRVVDVQPFASRVIKRFASRYPRINVATRNFSIGADALRAKLRVRDGGSLRLYGITDARGEQILAVTEPA
ncbi:MAG: class I SAM-dependent methyltransferase [Muribaculaceae bacterium]|nr:class I SAM-dependent methyltransferase [Muribaculaceae bacterium]